MPRSAFAYDRKCVESLGRTRAARHCRREAHRARGHEDGDCRGGPDGRRHRSIELRQGINGFGRTKSSDAKAGGELVKLTINALRTLYNSAQAKPSDIIAEVYGRIGRETQPVWVSLVPRDTAMARAQELEDDPAAGTLPLYGIP